MYDAIKKLNDDSNKAYGESSTYPEVTNRINGYHIRVKLIYFK